MCRYRIIIKKDQNLAEMSSSSLPTHLPYNIMLMGLFRNIGISFILDYHIPFFNYTI